MRALIALCIFAVFIRSLVSVHHHSGEGAAPIRGDYEAQRHWMEITSQLSVREWYWGNHSYNDLQYWGLDYPPLTAYHSMVLGLLGLQVCPDAFALYTSRGAEDMLSKAFMRLTVMASDVLVYIPAVVAFFVWRRSRPAGLDAIFFALVQPALLLIDHGHFQFNGVCLGFVVGAMAFVTGPTLAEQMFGSALFVCALMFKHMALYFAPSFFVYLLHQSFGKGFVRGMFRVACLGFAVLATLAVILFPLRYDVLQVLHRMFPIGRGIFEDKVANFWCSISPVIKVKQLYSSEQLFRICSITTLVAIMPSCFIMFFVNRHVAIVQKRVMFALNLATVSLSFFIFGFQVHEKNILMPLLPLTLLYDQFPVLVTWYTSVACFSMFPLLVRDGLGLPYVCAMLCLLCLGRWSWLTLLTSVPPMMVIHFLMAWVDPPATLPYLWVQACTSYSFAIFAIIYVVLHSLQLTLGRESS